MEMSSETTLIITIALKHPTLISQEVADDCCITRFETTEIMTGNSFQTRPLLRVETETS